MKPKQHHGVAYAVLYHIGNAQFVLALCGLGHSFGISAVLRQNKGDARSAVGVQIRVNVKARDKVIVGHAAADALADAHEIKCISVTTNFHLCFCIIADSTLPEKLRLFWIDIAGPWVAGDPGGNIVSLVAQLLAVAHLESIAQRLYACTFGVRVLRAHGCANAGIAGGEHGQCHQADQQAGQ